MGVLQGMLQKVQNRMRYDRESRELELFYGPCAQQMAPGMTWEELYSTWPAVLFFCDRYNKTFRPNTWMGQELPHWQDGSLDFKSPQKKYKTGSTMLDVEYYSGRRSTPTPKEQLVPTKHIAGQGGGRDRPDVKETRTRRLLVRNLLRKHGIPHEDPEPRVSKPPFDPQEGPRMQALRAAIEEEAERPTPKPSRRDRSRSPERYDTRPAKRDYEHVDNPFKPRRTDYYDAPFLEATGPAHPVIDLTEAPEREERPLATYSDASTQTNGLWRHVPKRTDPLGGLLDGSGRYYPRRRRYCRKC